MQDNYYINIPATYVTPVKNPSQRLLDFKKKVVPTFDDMIETLADEIEKGTFH